MSAAIVSIKDVFPEALQIQARDLKAGDKVFDACGGTHALVDVRRLKSGAISTLRKDGWRDRFEAADLITILRG